MATHDMISWSWSWLFHDLDILRNRFEKRHFVLAFFVTKSPLFKDHCEKPQNVKIMEKPGSWPRDHENPWSKNLRSRIPWDHDHEIIQFLGSKPWDHGFMIHWSSNFQFEDHRIIQIMIYIKKKKTKIIGNDNHEIRFFKFRFPRFKL